MLKYIRRVFHERFLWYFSFKRRRWHAEIIIRAGWLRDYNKNPAQLSMFQKMEYKKDMTLDDLK